jgi:peptide/nickel transport system substrate-binding protein
MRKCRTFYFVKILSVLAIFTILPSCLDRKKANNSNSELRFGFTTEPSTFDPLNPKGTADGRSILFNVFEGLVKPDTSGRMQPCIAESWTIEQDASIYNFKIREGVLFHDGSLLNSGDVKFSLDTAIAAGYTGLDIIQNVEITGEFLISVMLKTPDPDFLPFLSYAIIKAGNNDREKNIIGTGPFFIESYKPEQNLVLRKFERYWQRFLDDPKDIPHLDKVTIIFFANNDSQMIALRGGSIDGASLTGTMAAQLEHRYFDVFHSYSAAVQLFALNNNRYPFDDTRVRLAMNYGIDVQGIIDTAFFGAGVPSGSPVIPGLIDYYNASLGYPYEPDTARSLLDEAGFSEGGRKLSIEITVPSNYTMHVDTAQVIASQLDKIGVDTSIKLVDWATWLNDVYLNRQFMSTVISLDSPDVSPRSFLSRYHSQNSSNFINFKNSNFDRVFDSCFTETDYRKRISLYREVQRIITANAASVYIQDIFYFKVFRAGAFKGVLNYPLYVIDFASIYGT